MTVTVDLDSPRLDACFCVDSVNVALCIHHQTAFCSSTHTLSPKLIPCNNHPTNGITSAKNDLWLSEFKTAQKMHQNTSCILSPKLIPCNKHLTKLMVQKCKRFFLIAWVQNAATQCSQKCCLSLQGVFTAILGSIVSASWLLREGEGQTWERKKNLVPHQKKNTFNNALSLGNALFWHEKLSIEKTQEFWPKNVNFYASPKADIDLHNLSRFNATFVCVCFCIHKSSRWLCDWDLLCLNEYLIHRVPSFLLFLSVPSSPHQTRLSAWSQCLQSFLSFVLGSPVLIWFCFNAFLASHCLKNFFWQMNRKRHSVAAPQKKVKIRNYWRLSGPEKAKPHVNLSRHFLALSINFVNIECSWTQCGPKWSLKE